MPRSFISGRSCLAVACVVLAATPLAAPAAHGAARRSYGTAVVRIAAKPVPAVLTSAESNAEDIVGFALSGKRAKMMGQTVALQKAMNPATRAMLAAAGVPQATLATLRMRIDHVVSVAPSGSFVTVALAGNAVSQLMPAIYSRFSDPIPPQVLALDYLEREAQLRSLVHDQSGLASVVSQLARTWRALQPKVTPTTGGPTAAATYSAHVTTMQQLAKVAGKPLEKEATRGLELVDGLEKLFTH